MRVSKKKKYTNKKVVVDGITFDSIKESKRYLTLKRLEQIGEISNLTCQPKYKFKIDGKPLKTPLKGSRQLSYIADFKYLQKNGVEVVEDVKSPITASRLDFKYKMALMWTIYGIEVKLV